MNTRRLILIAAAAATSALVAPAGADAAVCYKALDGGASIEVKQNGAQAATAELNNGSVFTTDHATLTVNGMDYPAADDNACTTTDTSIDYPWAPYGAGLSVKRQVSSAEGRLRWIETITNASGALKFVDVDFAFEVLGSQASVASGMGDGPKVDATDHWSVHKNQGNSFPFLQWGQKHPQPLDPTIHSSGKDVWEPQNGAMADAFLHYEDIPIGPGKTIQLMHTGGATGSQQASIDAASNGAAPFSGMTRDEAVRIVNWGDDPDNDDTSTKDDLCPGVRGNNEVGCLELESKPFEKPADKPADQPAGGGGSPAADTPPAVTPPAITPPVVAPRSAADVRAPRITVTKLGRSAKRSLIAGRGLKPRIACDEACSVKVEITGRKRGSRKATTLLTRSARGGSLVPLKLKAGLSRTIKRVIVTITATDAAGNRSTVKRTVKVTR